MDELRIGGRISILIILHLIILGFYLSPASAKAQEPAEDVIQELIRGDAQAASTASIRAPHLFTCKKMRENNKFGQLLAQGDPFSAYCKLYGFLAQGDLRSGRLAL